MQNAQSQLDRRPETKRRTGTRPILNSRQTARSDQACYRRLRSYKYQLVLDFRIPVNVVPETVVETPYLELTIGGVLTVKRGYAWDGPSGLTFDTSTFMRASLVHDALYQLMRLRFLDHWRHRKVADDLLRTMCIVDGMNVIRAWYVHRALRWFGGSNARPKAHKTPLVICNPA